MKKVRSLSASFCAALFLTALCACAIPLVPNSRLSGNTLISSRGELITEITFTNASPYIPENTKGPELDQTPVLIPSPSNPAQLGWILFPANQTNKGRDIVSVSKSGLPNGGSLFGYYLDGSKQRHNIDVSSQINSVSRLQIDLPNPGQPYSRISAFPLNEGNVPNRLIVLTQGDSTSNSYQLYV